MREEGRGRRERHTHRQTERKTEQETETETEPECVYAVSVRFFIINLFPPSEEDFIIEIPEKQVSYRV